MERVPVDVLAGVPFDVAEGAAARLRDAGIPVSVRDVLGGDSPGSWVRVAAVDAGRARSILAASGILAATKGVDGATTVPAPGDDVWGVLMQE